MNRASGYGLGLASGGTSLQLVGLSWDALLHHFDPELAALRIVRETFAADREEAFSVIPDEPGAYLFRDRDGRTVYVGTAKSLRKRNSALAPPGKSSRITRRPSRPTSKRPTAIKSTLRK